jgi:hypothetical protein
MPVGGALASAKLAKAGFAGYALAITLCLVLGGCCAWTMEAAGARIFVRIQRQPVSLGERYARAIYFAAIVWIVFALFLGSWITSSLMRRLG